MDRITRATLSTAVAATVLIGFLVPGPSEARTGQGSQNDRVIAYHFDVGQANATLIRAPGCTLLIDAGRWDRDDLAQHLRLAGISHIDIMILTHPHADHIGQADVVLDEYDVEEVWATGWENDSQTFERTIDAIDASGAAYEEPRAGHTERCGTTVLEVVHPVEPLEGIHDNLAVRVHHRHAVLFYPGDAEAEHEREMLQRQDNLDADWLHLGHHGSSTSSTPEFLDAVDPAAVIYAAGRDNRYGHPHDEILERMANRGIETYGTDEHGTVILVADEDGLRVGTNQ